MLNARPAATRAPDNGTASPTANAALRVLVIDDEPDVAEILARVIRTCGDYEVDIRTGAFDIERELPGIAPDLIFLDLVIPDFDGFDVIPRIKSATPDVPVVVISAYSTIENAVRAIKTGAFDFLPKPFDPDSVALIIAKTEQDLAFRARYVAVHDSHIGCIRGESTAMRDLREWILKIRSVSASVLIEGESGTGKELIARAIHAGRGPFVAINMASIPDELSDSELFGHRRGAFTGATQDRKGLFVEANGGTLFLDEVNTMSPLLQAKLLRVLQERRLRPVGSDQEIEVDFRVVSATNESLESLVAQGRFRRDLYHRLRVLSCTLPPLRERRDDIALLAEEFVHRYSRAHGKRARRLTPEALLYLKGLDWPGNVRELENLIEETVILCADATYEIDRAMFTERPGRTPSGERQDDPACSLAEAERRHIEQVMELAQGNKARAARILQIDYKTLLRKLAREETT